MPYPAIIGPTIYAGYDLGQSPIGEFAFEYGTDQYFFGCEEGYGTDIPDWSCHALRSTDKGLTWLEVDAANAPPTSPYRFPMVSMVLDRSLNKVILVWIYSTNPDPPFPLSDILGFTVCSFDLVTGLWGTPQNFTDPIPSTWNPTIGLYDNAVVHQIVQRDANEYVLLYYSQPETISTVPYARVSYVTVTTAGPTWVFGTETALPGQSGIAFDTYLFSAACDSAKITHILYAPPAVEGAANISHIALDNSNVFGSSSVITLLSWWGRPTSFGSGAPYNFANASQLKVITDAFDAESLAVVVPIDTGVNNPVIGSNYSEMHMFYGTAALNPAWLDSLITNDPVLGYVTPGTDYPLNVAMALGCHNGNLTVIWSNSPDGGPFVGTFNKTYNWYSSTAVLGTFTWSTPSIFDSAPDFSGASGTGAIAGQVFIFDTSDGSAVITQWLDNLNDELALFHYPATAPNITCNNPPSGVANAPYSHAFPATGGTPPYTFSIVTGALPTGVTLDTSSGIVSGTPTVIAVFNFGVRVTDANGLFATVGCSINIVTIYSLWRADFYSTTDGWQILPSDGIEIQYTIWRYWPIENPTADYQVGEVSIETENPVDDFTADVFYNYATTPTNTITVAGGLVPFRNRLFNTVNSGITAVQYSIGLRLIGVTGHSEPVPNGLPGLTNFYTFFWRDFPWSDAGYPCPKTFGWINIQANTEGIAIPMHLQVDGVNVFDFNLTGTFFDRASTITLPSNITGTQYRVVPASGYQGTLQLYGVEARYERLPCAISHFDSLCQVFGSEGYKFLWQAWFDYQSTVPLIVTIYRDGHVLFYQKTLPANTERNVQRFYFPPTGDTPSAPIPKPLNKSISYQVLVDPEDGVTTFQMYRDGTRLEVRNLSTDQRANFDQKVVWELIPVAS